MFFHQDDIGLLVLLHQLPFFQFIITPQAAHFMPIALTIWSIFYRLFHLNFLPYSLLVVGMHLVDTLLLAKIVREITGKRFWGFVAAGIFVVNLTYTEVLLTINASSIALFFIGLAFLYWWRFITTFAGPATRVSQDSFQLARRYHSLFQNLSVHISSFTHTFFLLAHPSVKLVLRSLTRVTRNFQIISSQVQPSQKYSNNLTTRLPAPKRSDGGQVKQLSNFSLSVFFSFLAGMTFGIGTGIGMVFAVATLLAGRGKREAFSGKREAGSLKYAGVYFITGVVSFLLGPIFSPSSSGAFVPKMLSSFNDLGRYVAFVIVGISRGVVGRLFLPGFEPPNEDIVGTLVSFIPFISVLCIMYYVLCIKRRKKILDTYYLLLTTISFVVYPYVWAGFLRYQFGLKQALAERYAYPSLFFFAILFSLLLQKLWEMGKIRSRKIIIGSIIVLFVLHSYFFGQNARIYLQRQLQERDYFQKLEMVIAKTDVLLNLPLPSYINQTTLSLKDILPVINEKRKIATIPLDEDFCTEGLKRSLKNKEVRAFYEEQVRDKYIKDFFDKKKLDECGMK